MHRWRKIPGALVELNSVCYMTPRSAMLGSGETTSDREPRRENGSSVFARVCTGRSSHAHLRTTGQRNRHTNSPLSLFNLTDRSRKIFRLFVPVPIRDIPGALSALRDCCLCVCVSLRKRVQRGMKAEGKTPVSPSLARSLARSLSILPRRPVGGTTAITINPVG